ncbi:hypothetical protein [Streptomyces sp. 2P-4]|uniref:hypothetical protein n=1 Tax=Streptomyces sp. 2P-4 TaxID=2931974 RepID=UPI00254046DC|nr:hypothetical protein [Streptomyces sp. 2P-4]
MTTRIPPHRQYTVPRISLADIEWQLRRSEVRALVGSDLPRLAARCGLTPDEALNYLATAPRWLLAPATS